MDVVDECIGTTRRPGMNVWDKRFDDLPDTMVGCEAQATIECRGPCATCPWWDSAKVKVNDDTR